MAALYEGSLVKLGFLFNLILLDFYCDSLGPIKALFVFFGLLF